MPTPPTFVAGQPLTAAQMNTIGMHLIKTQTVGASAVPSVSVTSVFSADYDNYLVTLDAVTFTVADTTIWVRPGNDTGAATYSSSGIFVSFTGTPGYHANNGTTTGIGVGITSTTSGAVAFDVLDPYLAKWTRINGHGNTGDAYAAFYAGVQKNTTQYTSLTIAPASGNMSNGTIRVYGYRNS